MKKRFEKIQQALGVSGNEFDIVTGCNGFSKGSGNATLETLERIARAYPQLNLYYIVLGVGPIFIEPGNDIKFQELCVKLSSDLRFLRAENERLHKQLCKQVDLDISVATSTEND